MEHTDLTRLWAFPMHGEVKLRPEGFRTRDAHLCEWFVKLGVLDLHLASRPEPWPRLSLARGRHQAMPCPPQFRWHSPEILRVPSLSTRRSWWDRTKSLTPLWDEDIPDAAVVWNPFAFERIGSARTQVPVLFDLLDDWTIHHQFEPIRDAVEAAYTRAFAIADLVFANSEGTVRLAERFGRNDVTLMLNGVDPERFTTTSTASGRTTIGYAGKLSDRLDIDLIRRAVVAFPDCRFVIAGPFSNRQTRVALRSITSLELVGDVPYSAYPDLLASWDLAWVPHRTGDGEIGGDVIKMYEYRAAGLPTFSTPIEGAGRGLDGVRVAAGADLLQEIAAIISQSDHPRITREVTQIPPGMTWRMKAESMLTALAGT